MVDDTERNILNLMYYAFIEIRSSTVAGPPKAAFALADIFHNVLLQLLQARDGKLSYAEIYSDIRARAERHKMMPWIDSVLSH